MCWIRSKGPGCRFARGMRQVPVPGPSGPGCRAQYAQVQWEYSKNRSRCTQDVISGAWQDPPTHLPMGVQEPLWQSF